MRFLRKGSVDRDIFETLENMCREFSKAATNEYRTEENWQKKLDHANNIFF